MKTIIIAFTVYYVTICHAAHPGESSTTNLRPREIIQNPQIFKVIQDETYPNRKRIIQFEARWRGNGKKLEDFIPLNDPNFPEIKQEFKTLEAYNVPLVPSITDSPSQTVSTSEKPDGSYFQLVSKLYERLSNGTQLAKEGKSEIRPNTVQRLFLVHKPSGESKEITMPPGIFDIKGFKQQPDDSVQLEYVKRKEKHDPDSENPPHNVIVTVSVDGNVRVQYDGGPKTPGELIPGQGPWSVIHPDTTSPPATTKPKKIRNGVPRGVINTG